MCCFSRPVQAVSATNIFARPDKGGRQFLVYSMTLKAKEDLAMVLPLPVKVGSGEKAVTFIDLKNYPGFFADLLSGFPRSAHLLGLADAGVTQTKRLTKLEVVTVGDFEASYVPTVDDFSRLDERFRLPPGTWEKLPAYRSYGFAVFKLKPGAATIHPMAFSFPRADASSLFFPTVHIHDGKVRATAAFDHTLYCQGGDGEEFEVSGWTESERPANFFMATGKVKGLVDGARHCYKKEPHGKLPNNDTILPRA
jgi:hypothetical protein